MLLKLTIQSTIMTEQLSITTVLNRTETLVKEYKYRVWMMRHVGRLIVRAFLNRKNGKLVCYDETTTEGQLLSFFGTYIGLCKSVGTSMLYYIGGYNAAEKLRSSKKLVDVFRSLSFHLKFYRCPPADICPVCKEEQNDEEDGYCDICGMLVNNTSEWRNVCNIPESLEEWWIPENLYKKLDDLNLIGRNRKLFELIKL